MFHAMKRTYEDAYALAKAMFTSCTFLTVAIGVAVFLITFFLVHALT